MQKLETLTIFGTGLIGGSVAFAARRAGVASRIVCIDHNPPPSAALLEAAGTAQGPAAAPFDQWLLATDRARVEQAFDESSLILLCTPVRSIIAELPRALASGAVVSDCGSTKRAVAEAARACPQGARFVPGHPMAGGPIGGWAHASAELFDSRRWLFCPENTATDALETMTEFASALGAVPVLLSAATHDRSVAITSHLPQVMASALSALAGSEQALAAAGPGFASATRVAGGPAPMWTDIFETNGEEIGRALLLLARELERAGQALSAGDLGPVSALLERARAQRDKP